MSVAKCTGRVLFTLLILLGWLSCSKNETEPPSVEDYFKPQAAFSYQMRQEGTSMRVDFTNTTPNKQLYIYKWEVGEGITYYTMNASHLYVIPFAKPALYTVVLTATDTISNTYNRVSQVITINPVDPE